MDLHQSDGQKDRKGSSKKRKNKKVKKSGRPSPRHKHTDGVDCSLSGKSKRQKQKQSGHRERGKNKKSHQQCSRKNSLLDTDDVIAQLQRQRQKKQAEQASSEGTSGQACPRQPLTLGGYRFDPQLKRYLPKKAFKPNGNNDVCIQRVKSRQVNDTNIAERTMTSCNAPMSIQHWGRILICTASGRQGTCLGGAQAQSEPMQPAVTVLNSLQYCNRTAARVTLTKSLMPKPKVAPIASTIDHIAEHDGTCGKIDSCTPHALTCTQRSSRRFFSMVKPLPTESRDRGDEQRSWGHQLPDDCGCKKSSSTLSTFDVLPYSKRDPRVLPDMITISNNRIFYRSRLQKLIRCRSSAAFTRNYSLGVARFAPFKTSQGETIVVHSLHLDEAGSMGYGSSAFCVIQAIGRDFKIREFPPSRVGLINDIAFSQTKCSSGVIGIAHSFEDRHRQQNWDVATFIDISPERISTTCPRRIRQESEPLCINFRNEHDAIFGHRNGCVQLYDRRSSSSICSANYELDKVNMFGSVTSVLPLRNNGNVVLARGSFGTCRLFDLRRLGNKTQSHVYQYTLPELPGLSTQTGGCTGIAVDPGESIIVAPYTTRKMSDGAQQLKFAIWDVGGDFLCEVPVGKSKANGSIFCELSSVVTPGYGLHRERGTPFIANIGRFGLWYKTNAFADDIPSRVGGVHHIVF